MLRYVLSHARPVRSGVWGGQVYHGGGVVAVVVVVVGMVLLLGVNIVHFRRVASSELPLF